MLTFLPGADFAKHTETKVEVVALGPVFSGYATRSDNRAVIIFAFSLDAARRGATLLIPTTAIDHMRVERVAIELGNSQMWRAEICMKAAQDPLTTVYEQLLEEGLYRPPTTLCTCRDNRESAKVSAEAKDSEGDTRRIPGSMSVSIDRASSISDNKQSNGSWNTPVQNTSGDTVQFGIPGSLSIPVSSGATRYIEPSDAQAPMPAEVVYYETVYVCIPCRRECPDPCGWYKRRKVVLRSTLENYRNDAVVSEPPPYQLNQGGDLST
jgi:hypothetical protein